jgi:hypothetical protein
MKLLRTILVFPILPAACCFCLVQASPQTLTVEPHAFLAKKPIHTTLRFDGPVNDARVQLLPGGPFKKDSIQFSPYIQATITNNHFRYTALPNQGIEIVDINAPGMAPRYIGDKRLAYSSLTVNDSLLLAVTTSGVAQLFSLGPDGDHSLPIGVYDTFANIVQAHLAQQYAFLLSDGGTLYTLDISNPEWPLLAGEYYASPESTRFAVREGLIWLAAGSQGLVVLDMANPLQPKLMGSYKTNHPANDVALQGDIALVTSGLSGLTLVDISDPANIFWLGSHSKLGQAQRVVANEFFQAAVSNNANEVYHIDFSSPD